MRDRRKELHTDIGWYRDLAVVILGVTVLVFLIVTGVVAYSTYTRLRRAARAMRQATAVFRFLKGGFGRKFALLMPVIAFMEGISRGFHIAKR